MEIIKIIYCQSKILHHLFREKNYGIITSIVLEKDFRDGKAIKLLSNAFKHKIKILEKSGKYFFGLVCDCVSIDGIKYVINNFNGKYLCNSIIVENLQV